MLAAFLVGDPVDLPSDLSGAPIAGLVGLRLESPTVPRHVVDLDAPFRDRVGAVEVDHDPVAEAERILADEHDAVRLEGSQHSELERRIRGTLPGGCVGTSTRRTRAEPARPLDDRRRTVSNSVGSVQKSSRTCSVSDSKYRSLSSDARSNHVRAGLVTRIPSGRTTMSVSPRTFVRRRTTPRHTGVRSCETLATTTSATCVCLKRQSRGGTRPGDDELVVGEHRPRGNSLRTKPGRPSVGRPHDGPGR